MKNPLRGIKRNDLQLDFSLYRVDVPIPHVAGAALSVIDIWPEEIEQTLMFIHGYAGVAETWEYQINAFSRTYRVLAPDLRGHGQSDAPYTQYTMDELVGDIHSIVEQRKLPEKFILVGHSFGGSICVEYANAHPERLEKLVLIATAGEYPLPRAAAWAYRIPTAFYRLWWDYRPRWNAEVHVMKRMMFNNMRKWRGWPLLRNIQTPTLIITGERDTYFPRYVFEDVGKMVPDAEVYDVGSAKHKVQLERHQAVNRVIKRFIGEDTKRSWRDQDTDHDILVRRPWLPNYSKETPWTIPVPRQPLYKFLEGAADWVPRRTAMIFYQHKWSYAQLEQQVNRFAHALRGLGVQPGDRVMINMPNMPHMVIAFYATMKVGGVVVLPNPDKDDAQMLEHIRETETRVFITVSDFHRGAFAYAVHQQGLVDTIVYVSLKDWMPEADYERYANKYRQSEMMIPPDERNWSWAFSMENLMEDASDRPLSIEVNSKDLAAIIYTSGTTEKPKGVCLSHSNLIANALQTRHWIPDLQYGEEIFLSVIPFMHCYGLTTALNIPLAMGATLVMLPDFDPLEVLESIKKYRPTIFPGVPTMYSLINLMPDVRSYGLSSIKACISGSAPLPVEIQESFEKLTRGRLVEGYGLTEAGPVTHANPLYGVRKVGTIGVPIPNTEAKIVDPDSHAPLPPGKIGELYVRGPQVMQGYWHDEAATVASFVEGWLATGDMAVADKDGYFRIVSRKQDLIHVDEHIIFPRDIEEVLYEHSKVVDVAVVGVIDAEGSTQVKAFVVLKPGAVVEAEQLLALAQKRLEAFQVPDEIVFRDALPKSFVGKTLRRLLV